MRIQTPPAVVSPCVQAIGGPLGPDVGRPEDSEWRGLRRVGVYYESAESVGGDGGC